MKSKGLNQLMLLVVSMLSVVLLSTMALAEADLNINDRNMVRLGGDLRIPTGQVVENAHAIGGDVTLEAGARVTQTAIAIGGDVVLARNARVDGDAYAVGGEIIQAEGASIGGASQQVLTAQTRWGMPGFRRGRRDGFLSHYGVGLVGHLLTVLLSAIVGVLILRWRPNFLLNLREMVRRSPWQCVLWGLGGIVAVTLLVVLLAVSLIGIPLLPLVGLTVGIIALLGTLGIALWIGERIGNLSRRTPTQQFLIGVLILGGIGLVPVLGGLILAAVNLVGFGAVLALLLGQRLSQTRG